MEEVTIRDLRNHGGEVVDRVAAGERLTVTRAGSRSPSFGRSRRPRWVPRRSCGGGVDSAPSIRRSSAPISTRWSTRSLMAEGAGLLDTSAVILLSRLRDAQALPPSRHLDHHARRTLRRAVDRDRRRRARRTARPPAAGRGRLRAAAVRRRRGACVRSGGRVASSLRSQDSARAYDAMIAAIALSNELPLYTCNPMTSPGSTA